MEQLLRQVDPDVADILDRELDRQQHTLIMIPSENYASRAVMAATGSIMTNKYAEGYPGARYYHGCEFVDQVETLAIARAKALFGVDHANVQPVSGTQANMAVYYALLEPGDTVLAMALDQGGHLSHGNRANFSGRTYRFVPYGVDCGTEQIDYDRLAEFAREFKPKLLLVGASAYPRTLDFARFRAIADSVGAYLLADIAHIAGLVAAGEHPSPAPYADVITSTTHKTLRGPRGAIILCRRELAKAIDKAVFPGVQAGPLMHVIAAKAVMFKEAMTPEFKAYQRQVIRNARALAETFLARGFRLVSGGTDTHLMLVDVSKQGLTGKRAADILREANIITNFNTIPYDAQPPTQGSGIRPGSPALTSRGMGEAEMAQIATWIADMLEQPDDAALRARIKDAVIALCDRFPIYDYLSREGEYV
ncbi:MAG TPA: serine hydroxymethyltransferase [Armatimonadota bacterium]|nr:serine hydroxymethyltransferase [Armatimonadota bacterium]